MKKSELTLAALETAVKQLHAPSARVVEDASRVDEVYEQILLKILRGELPGGTQIKSAQVARQFGLSRTPVIQALQRLAADGIVTLEMNKRAMVRPGAEHWLV